jgi:hypothetical protein
VTVPELGAAGAGQRVCQVHGSHRPALLAVHTHHIQPLGMGGDDEPRNRVDVCPSGHFNIHAILAALVFGRPLPGGTRREKQVAAQGFARWVEAGRPGNPHAAYGLQEVAHHG